MSVPVGAAEIRQQVARYGPVAYLVTVARETGRPHVVSVTVRWEGEALVSGAGSRTSANLGAGADVSLVWSPPPGDAYSLIVDGRAEIVEGEGGPLVSVRPTGSVLHRLAGVAGDGPGCIPVSTFDPPPTTGPDAVVELPGERGAGGDEHPNTGVIRRFVEAWFDGDVATWTSLAADDIVLHMRGTPVLNGDHRGHAGVTACFVKFSALGIESFEAEAEDLIADDRFAMAMVRTSYQRGEEHLLLRNACNYRFDDRGLVAEIWALSDAQDAERAFFRDPDPSGLGIGLGDAVIEHAGVAKARGFLDAFARGDAQAMGDYFTDDLAWHVGGGHRWSGDHRGRQELVAYFCQLREDTDGTYFLAAESVLATDHHTAVFARATARREGRALDVLQSLAFTVRSDGMWGEYWVSTAEQELEDAFWA